MHWYMYQYQGWIPILWNSNTYAWCCQGWKVDKYVELPGFKARLLRLDNFNPREAFGQFRGSQQSLPSPKILFWTIHASAIFLPLISHLDFAISPLTALKMKVWLTFCMYHDDQDDDDDHQNDYDATTTMMMIGEPENWNILCCSPCCCTLPRFFDHRVELHSDHVHHDGDDIEDDGDDDDEGYICRP